QHELSGGEKQKEDAAGLIKTSEILLHRYGRINLSVGQILSLDDIRQELNLAPGSLRPAQRRQLVTRLGNRVMDEINRVTAVTPGALTALALLSYRGRGLVHEELLLRCQHLLDVCVRERARLSPALVTNTGQLRAVAIREALQMFVDARYVDSFPLGGSEPKPERAKGERRVSPNSAYSVVEERRLALDTSKNVLIHF